MGIITRWPSPTGWGVETSGGMVRVGAAHYNTVDEVKRFGEALKKIAS